MSAGKHVDIVDILEDHAWRLFEDLQSVPITRNEDFRKLKREDVEFEVITKKLQIVNEDPVYEQLNLKSSEPCILFKSAFTNNTDHPQEYSFKTERKTESVCLVCKEQGYSIGRDTELSLKIPSEIFEMKTGFKRELNFNHINENSISELLTWGVDSKIVVPANSRIDASIVIDEVNYRGSYVLSVTTNIIDVFKMLVQTGHVTKDVKAMVTVEPNAVKLVSKGICAFQFASEQKIDLIKVPMPIGAIE
uniref:Uncharacterized protein n=1 Tax=Plectus sambesii TaxID=2011161 RepID=A0A914WD50_9BILA